MYENTIAFFDLIIVQSIQKNAFKFHEKTKFLLYLYIDLFFIM